MYMFHVYKRVDISILVMCDDGDVTGYDRRRPELCNAPLHNKRDNTSIALYPLILSKKN